MTNVCIYLSCESPLSHLNDVRYQKPQIGIRCSGAKKYSQRYKIDHFRKGDFSANKIGGWGSRTEGSPTGKSSSEFNVFAPAPARTTRQINGARRLVARPF